MGEWQVVGVIIALVGLVGAIVGPIIKLNTNITRLTVTMETIARQLSDQEESNHKSHERLWKKNDEQDRKLESHGKALTEHEGRISRLEEKRNGG